MWCSNWREVTPVTNVDDAMTTLSQQLIDAFRRDGTAHPGYTQPSKTIDLTVLMSTSDLATFGAAFAAHYKAAPVTVVQPRQVSVPDWTLVPPVVEPSALL